MAEVEVRDRLDVPAWDKPCERCSSMVLLLIGGLCADCVAVIGLAVDRGEYVAWRQRVSEETVAAAAVRGGG